RLQMGPLGHGASCEPRHRTENNLCRPPHAGARHGKTVASTSAHHTTRHGEPNTTSVPKDGLGVSFGVMPRQTCPQPEGLGHNLHSKTRWFAGLCNSHQVSHFATFFIDARAEISVAGSRVGSDSNIARGMTGRPNVTRARQYQCSLTPSAPWGLWRPFTNVEKVRSLGRTVARRHG